MVLNSVWNVIEKSIYILLKWKVSTPLYTGLSSVHCSDAWSDFLLFLRYSSSPTYKIPYSLPGWQDEFSHQFSRLMPLHIKQTPKTMSNQKTNQPAAVTAASDIDPLSPGGTGGGAWTIITDIYIRIGLLAVGSKDTCYYLHHRRMGWLWPWHAATATAPDYNPQTS